MDMAQPDSRTKLLDATLRIVRSKGYAATRIEDVCAEAGLTKGSFFHHFKSKEDLGRAAAAHWDAHVAEFFAAAPYHAKKDPLDRLLAYVDFRKSILTDDFSRTTCFAGTIVQEAWHTHPEIAHSCGATIAAHAKTLEPDIRAAMRQYGVRGSAESLALHIQAVIQGSFILAKAKENAEAGVDSLNHLKRYIELLFAGAGKARRK